MCDGSGCKFRAVPGAVQNAAADGTGERVLPVFGDGKGSCEGASVYMGPQICKDVDLGFDQLFTSPPKLFAKRSVLRVAFDFVTKPLCFGAPLLEILFRFGLVIEVPGNSTVDVRKRKRWEAVLNLLGSAPLFESAD